MNSLIKIVTEVVCRNTIPGFDKKGKPVLIWKASVGYKDISRVISDVFDGPQAGDIGELKNWLDLGEGLYRYKVDDEAAYEIRILRKRPDADILDSIADMYIVGIVSPTTGPAYFERLMLIKGGSLKLCLKYAKKDMEGAFE